MIEGLYGAVVFGKAEGRIMTFHEVERKYAGRYTSHMVHLSKPLLEWAGNDLLEIRMPVHLNSSWCGDPNRLLAQWHLFHENGMFAPLIIGGKPMGPGMSLFVITEIQETHKAWLPGGTLISVQIELTFKEYRPFTEGII